MGSNVYNLAFILGVLALFGNVAVPRTLVRRDGLALLGATTLAALVLLDFRLGRLEAAILLLALVAYFIALARAGSPSSSSSVADAETVGARTTRFASATAGVFEERSGMSDEGQRARSTIRDRLSEYDDVPRHPDSGDYSDPRRRERKQYVLPETNAESVVRCPLPERFR